MSALMVACGVRRMRALAWAALALALLTTLVCAQPRRLAAASLVEAGARRGDARQRSATAAVIGTRMAQRAGAYSAVTRTYDGAREDPFGDSPPGDGASPCGWQ